VTASSVEERLILSQLEWSAEEANDRQGEQVRRRDARLVSVLCSLALFIALYDMAMLAGVHQGWSV
jgi:hypothetical protein